MRHLVVRNPFAGRKRGRSVDALEAGLRSRGLDYDLVTTRAPGHASEIVSARGARYDAIVVVGGDGTVHEVIQALDLGRHRLGVLPWGSGNDFAWTQGWSPDRDACLDRIAAGGERRVDIAEFRATTPRRTRSGRLHNSAGLGFEATVNAASHRVTTVTGPAIYLVALLRSLPRYRNYRVRLSVDGVTREETVSLLSLANGARVGGCFLIAPGADPADGRLDLVGARGMGLLRALWLLPGLFSGRHLRSSRVWTERAGSVRVESEDGIPLYVDGEFVDHRVSSLDVRVLPRALRMF